MATRLDPIRHAEEVTGRRQSALIDLWADAGFAAALSRVDRPHVYAFGDLPVPTVAITLYNVRRHVLIENGRVRRDGPVAAGRFRIGAAGRDVLVDAVPAGSGDLLLLYLGDALLRDAGSARGAGPVALMDRAWDVDDPLLTLAARRVVEASEAQAVGRSLLAEQMAYSLALHLADRYAVPGARPAQPPAAIDDGLRARLTDLVRADPAADLSLAVLAREAGLTPSGFIRAFRRATGVTPHRFVVEERVRAAGDLLASGRMTIAEIALATGFSSQSHLGAAFRQVMGTSPARWRDRQRR